MFKPVKLVLVFALSLALGFQTFGQAQTQAQNEKSDKSKPKVAIVLGGKRLGIVAGHVTKERAESLKLSEKRGVLVRDVIKNSPADRAGLKSGDVIIEVDGQAIESHGDLRRKTHGLDYDKSYSMKIVRDGNTQQLAFTLEKSSSDEFYAYSYGQNEEEIKRALEKSREAFEKSREARKKALEGSKKSLEKSLEKLDKAGAEGRARGEELKYFYFGRPRLGVETQSVTEQLAKYFGVEKGKGVLISHVSEDSAGAKAGLLAGDVVVEVNGVEINHSGDLRHELNKVESGEVRLIVFRNRQRIELRANLEPRTKVGENFNLEFSSVFPPAALPPFEGKVFVVPEVKDLFPLKNIPQLENFPGLNFDFDDLDFDIYL